MSWRNDKCPVPAERPVVDLAIDDDEIPDELLIGTEERDDEPPKHDSDFGM